MIYQDSTSLFFRFYSKRSLTPIVLDPPKNISVVVRASKVFARKCISEMIYAKKHLANDLAFVLVFLKLFW